MLLRFLIITVSTLVLIQDCQSQQPEQVKGADGRTPAQRESDSLFGAYVRVQYDSALMKALREQRQAELGLAREQELVDSLRKEAMHITRIQYPHFGLIIHGMRAYIVIENYNYPDQGPQYFFSFDTLDARFKPEAWTEEGEQTEKEKEWLIAKTDTLGLSEDLDERMNNTLLQIVPENKADQFRIFFCYLAGLSEVIDERQHNPADLDRLYKQAREYKHMTRFVELRDSAGYYFRSLPHSADMVAVTVKDSQIVALKPPNSPEQQHWEEQYFLSELARVKQKYHMHDTSVVIPGEMDRYANLTRNGKLFNFYYHSYFFRIERLRAGKLIERRMLRISIQYGC
ncbi:MAG TPA: hypothetical protein PLQ93_13185 [Bacteroidia bacterium]|nr:hypothetical protein [Bacteroidia bacterium]